VFALTPFDRDGVAADYVALPTAALAAKPRSLQLARHAGAILVEGPPADLVFDTVGGELPFAGAP
jgi:NADPH:quinone reductase-like Zn-dependent oxidoreductase